MKYRIRTSNECIWCTTQLAKLSFNHSIGRTHSWRFSTFYSFFYFFMPPEAWTNEMPVHYNTSYISAQMALLVATRSQTLRVEPRRRYLFGNLALRHHGSIRVRLTSSFTVTAVNISYFLVACVKSFDHRVESNSTSNTYVLTTEIPRVV